MAQIPPFRVSPIALPLPPVLWVRPGLTARGTWSLRLAAPSQDRSTTPPSVAADSENRSVNSCLSTRDLPGRPAQGPLRFQQRTQGGLPGLLPLLRAAATFVGGGIGCCLVVVGAALRAISRETAEADRPSRLAICRAARRLAGRAGAGYLVTLTAAQVPRRTSSRHRAHPAGLPEELAHMMHRNTRSPSGQAERLVPTPSLPDLVLLSRREPVITSDDHHLDASVRGRSTISDGRWPG